MCAVLVTCSELGKGDCNAASRVFLFVCFAYTHRCQHNVIIQVLTVRHVIYQIFAEASDCDMHVELGVF